MRKCCKGWWLALWALQAPGVHAQGLPPGAPPVPPDTAEIERVRAAESGKAKPATPDAGATPPAAPATLPPPAAAAQDESAAPPPSAADAGADTQAVLPAQPEPGAHAATAAAALPAAPAPQPQPDALWSAGALLGVGVTFDHTAVGVNPLGFGFGVQGTYRIADPWVVGARMLYFVGGSSDLPTERLSMQTWLVAAEGAVALRLDPLILQPGLLLGVHVREIDGRVLVLPGPNAAPGALNKTLVGLYLAPGLSVILPLGTLAREVDNLYAGMDVRLDLAFGSRVTSNLQLLFQLGVRF